MKKSIKIFLIIIIGIILILIPLIVLADNLFKIPVKISVTNECDLRQNKLKEKAEITNQLTESNLNDSNGTLISGNEDCEQEEVKLKQVIENFNKTEFTKILLRIENESSTKGLNSENPMFDAEIELYNLILDILENPKITSEEKNILENFLQENLYKIRTNKNLEQRVNIILKSNSYNYPPV